MTGVIVQVSVSPGGVPKRAVTESYIHPLGLTGDGHDHPQFHGGPRKAVLVISSEAMDELAAEGFPVFYGALGENLTTRGVDRRQFRPGQRWRAGGAVIELTQPRTPCSALEVYNVNGRRIQDAIFDAGVKTGDTSSPRWGVSGMYASVIEPGPVSPGDSIVLLSEFA